MRRIPVREVRQMSDHEIAQCLVTGRDMNEYLARNEPDITYRFPVEAVVTVEEAAKIIARGGMTS